MMMLPLAVRVPLMEEGLALLTRLRVRAWVEGWIKFVVSPCAISKLRQSMTALSLVWLTVRVVPELAILAEPADTVPSVGLATPAHGRALAMASASRDTPEDWLKLHLIGQGYGLPR